MDELQAFVQAFVSLVVKINQTQCHSAKCEIERKYLLFKVLFPASGMSMAVFEDAPPIYVCTMLKLQVPARQPVKMMMIRNRVKSQITVQSIK